MAKEYWVCVIGPIEREKLPLGADFPLRQAVKKAYEELTGDINYTCSSGWGADEEEAREISKVRNEAFQRRIRS